jgi:lipid II:glycine glycyltransferase (peptidoglycan interpeptide bridge formation enzyme)
MIPFIGTAQAWNELIVSVPLASYMQQSHYKQTWQWSLAKARVGWEPKPYYWQDASGRPIATAMVLKKSISVGKLAKNICVLYIPKGPIMDWGDENSRFLVLKDLQEYAKQQGAVYLKIEPDVPIGLGVPGTECAVDCIEGQTVSADLKRQGWKYSKEQLEHLNTILIDLTADENEMQCRMKRQTRQHIRQAQKWGVTVRTSTVKDLPLLYSMFEETAKRDGFILRDETHYQFVWRSYMEVAPSPFTLQPFMENMIAEVEGEAVAALSIFYHAGYSTALYGMRCQAHCEKMPNYLLQWETMRRAKALGCKVYDLYGIADEFNESSRLWNVFRFKAGLGGTVTRGMGAWDFSPKPLLYNLYIEVLPIVRDLLHRPGPPYINLEARHARSSKKKNNNKIHNENFDCE